MADSDKIVEAIASLHETTRIGVKAQEAYNESLSQQLGEIKNLLSGSSGGSGGDSDQRRSSNAYTRATRSAEEFRSLPEKVRARPRTQFAYGVKNAEGDVADGYLNLRRNVGLLNLPEAHRMLQEGHFQQAGYQVASGLVSSPYSRPFTIPSGLRLGAQGLDFARNRVIGQRLGQPNQMGMLGGAMGPGIDSFSSGLGSYVASLTAFPSIFASKTGEPFSMFGGSMAPAISQGYQMRKEAFMRSINPFDMMGYKQNLSLIEASRSKGFRSLGETYNVSESAKEIMQKVGIDAGTAIDVIDLSIKRLGLDAKEAQEEMEVFGKMARGAGKGVAQFAQETVQVLNQMSLQNTRGPGSLQAAALMSSVPQVQGQGVFNLLNSPTMLGLTMGSMAGQGASMSTMMAMAMGDPFSAGGGRESLEMMSQGLSSYKSTVDMFMRSAPGSTKEEKETFAFNMAAQTFGLDGPMTAQRIYNQTDKIKTQASTLESLNEMKSLEKFGVKGMQKQALGLGGGKPSKEVKSALDTLRKGFKQSASGGPMLPGMASPGITFADPSGRDNQAFNIYVNRMIQAKRFKTEDPTEVYQMAEDAGLDPEQVERAADLYIAAGRAEGDGAKNAFGKLASEFDISVGGNPMRGEKGFVSSELKELSKQNWQKLSAAQKNQYIKKGTETLDKALEGGLIKKPYYQKQLELVRKGEFDISAFEKRIAGTAAGQTQDQSRQLVDLTDDAKKLLKLLPNREASKRETG